MGQVGGSGPEKGCLREGSSCNSERSVAAGVPRCRVPLAAAATPPTGVTPKLRRWVEPLPVPPVFDGKGGDARFTIAAGESTTHRFNRDLGPATSWGYAGTGMLAALRG